MRGASTKVSGTSSVNSKYNLSQLVHCSLSFSPTMGYNLVNTVVCIVFSSKWMTHFQLHQSASNSEQVLTVVMQENETFTGVHWQLLACYGEDTVDINTVLQWVRKSWDIGGNLVLNDWPQSRSRVTATDHLNRRNV
jgi:hypothetical protein